MIGTEDVVDVEVGRELGVKGGGEEGGVGMDDESERKGLDFESGSEEDDDNDDEQQVIGITATDETGVDFEGKIEDEAKDAALRRRWSSATKAT